MRRSTLAALATMAIILGACGGNSSPKAIDVNGADPEESLAYVAANGQAAQSGVSVVGQTYDGVDEILPNAVMRCDCDLPDLPHKTILVQGKVTAVEKGVGGYWTENGEEEVTHRVPFGDPKSQINSLHLVFAVSEAIPAGAVGDVIRVGIRSPIEADITKTAAGWVGLGDLVLLIQKSGVYEYDSSIWSILDNELFTMPIAADGSLSLPFLGRDDHTQTGLLANTPTWAALKASATDRRLIVPVRQQFPPNKHNPTGVLVKTGPPWRE